MKRYVWTLLIVLSMMFAGCATPQLIDITSEPAKAAISINDEFIGKTPCTFQMEDVDDYGSLKVILEKSGFDSEMKRINKKKSGLYPQALHFVLEPSFTAGERKDAATGSQQQMGGQQMQGPTIVIPGVPALNPVEVVPQN